MWSYLRHLVRRITRCTSISGLPKLEIEIALTGSPSRVAGRKTAYLPHEQQSPVSLSMGILYQTDHTTHCLETWDWQQLLWGEPLFPRESGAQKAGLKDRRDTSMMGKANSKRKQDLSGLSRSSLLHCDILYSTMLSWTWLANHVINSGSPCVDTVVFESVFKQYPPHLWMQQKVELATPPMPLYL